MHTRFSWGTLLPGSTPTFHTLLWGNRSCSGCALQAILLDVPIQWISTVSLILTSPHASCCIFWKWLYAKLVRHRHQYLTAVQQTSHLQKWLPGMVVDSSWRCLYTELAWWLIETKMVLRCQRNCRVKATFVPPIMILVCRNKRPLLLPSCWRHIWKMHQAWLSLTGCSSA